ncbi:MAG TPA: ribonuclease E inhibitor RraB [Gaiellaceae bacterium]|nr:ribonuclease E inhibitor RraB [Gaiellaceae bacterium]
MRSATFSGYGSSVELVELLPDARDADERVLHHLRALGHDASRERGVRHFVYLPTRAAAHAVAKVLEREGWDTAVQEVEGIWLVVAGCLRVLTGPLVRETRERLASLAAAHGGAYDGWEADHRS